MYGNKVGEYEPNPNSNQVLFFFFFGFEKKITHYILYIFLLNLIHSVSFLSASIQGAESAFDGSVLVDVDRRMKAEVPSRNSVHTYSSYGPRM